MAATGTNIPAADLTARAADFPAPVARNALEMAYKIATANLVANTLGTIAGGDSSAAGFGVKYLVSRYKNLLWKASATGTDWYITIDQGATPPPLDTLIIDGHNWSGKTITVEADDSVTPPGTTWTGATVLWTFTPADNTTIVKLQATQTFAPRYLRIHISGTTFIPQAAQIWIGKAIQYPVGILQISSPQPGSSIGGRIEIVGETGIRTAYKTHKALRNRTINIIVQQSRTGTFFTALQDMFENANALDGGYKCFWWIDTPGSAPATSAVFVYLDSPEYRLAVNSEGGNPVTRNSLAWTEQGDGT